MLSVRSGAHKLFRRFFDFAIFDRNFATIVAPPGDKNANYLLHLKRQSVPKKKLKTESKSTRKRRHNTVVQTMCPSNKERAAHGA